MADCEQCHLEPGHGMMLAPHIGGVYVVLCPRCRRAFDAYARRTPEWKESEENPEGLRKWIERWIHFNITAKEPIYD